MGIYIARRTTLRFHDFLHALLLIFSVWTACRDRVLDEFVFSACLFALGMVRIALPDSPLVRLLLKWRGLSPQVGELHSEYLHRVAAMSFVIAVMCAFATIQCSRAFGGNFGDRLVFMGVAFFVIPIFGGMALFNAVVCGAKSWWLQTRGADGVLIRR